VECQRDRSTGVIEFGTKVLTEEATEEALLETEEDRGRASCLKAGAEEGEVPSKEET